MSASQNSDSGTGLSRREAMRRGLYGAAGVLAADRLYAFVQDDADSPAIRSLELDDPVAVTTVVRPEWVQGILGEPGVVVCASRSGERSWQEDES